MIAPIKSSFDGLLEDLLHKRTSTYEDWIQQQIKLGAKFEINTLFMLNVSPTIKNRGHIEIETKGLYTIAWHIIAKNCTYTALCVDDKLVPNANQDSFATVFPGSSYGHLMRVCVPSQFIFFATDGIVQYASLCISDNIRPR